MMSNHHPVVVRASAHVGASGGRALAAGAPSRASYQRKSKKASCVLHRLVTSCGKLPAGEQSLGESSGSRRRWSIDGTHLGPCRARSPFAGRPGEMSPWPWWARCASSETHRPCRSTLEVRASGRRRVGRFAGGAREQRVIRGGRPAQAGRTRARKLELLSGPCVYIRVASAEFARWDRGCRRRASARRAADDVGFSSRHRSGSVTWGVRVGSSLGRPPSCMRMPAQRMRPASGQPAAAGAERELGVIEGERPCRSSAGPLVREHSAGGGLQPSFGSRGPGRRGRHRHRPETAVDEADGAPTPPGGFPPSSARAGCVMSTASTGVRGIRGCARRLFWLQKSTRGVALGSLSSTAARASSSVGVRLVLARARGVKNGAGSRLTVAKS